MLWAKRLATFLVLLVILFPFFYIGTLAVGGGIAGARAAKSQGTKDYQSGFEAGRQAGADFGSKYRGLIFFGALGVSGAASCTIVFSGILSWCRNTRRLP